MRSAGEVLAVERRSKRGCRAARRHEFCGWFPCRRCAGDRCPAGRDRPARSAKSGSTCWPSPASMTVASPHRVKLWRERGCLRRRERTGHGCVEAGGLVVMRGCGRRAAVSKETSKWTVVPAPSMLCAWMVPPIMPTSRCEIPNPNAELFHFVSTDGPCARGSKISFCLSSDMPMPVSATLNCTADRIRGDSDRLGR